MRSKYEKILKEVWGYDSFRGVQEAIIESIGSGHDTLGLMPTGGGKSITFQVPALAMQGVCIVITPLVALMKDQVMHLHERGITAAAIHYAMSRDEIVTTLENAVFGGVKILYVSPERLSSDIFLAKLRHMQVSFICVDEAHCISQWGYDFRPSYLRIADIRKTMPKVPVLALTATATPEVVEDIQERLMFREKRVFRMSFERKNLAYVVRKADDKEEQLVHILKNVQGSAIVYARSRQRTKEYAEVLTRAGLSATYFHAGLETTERDERQKAWTDDKVRIMVATNAFGMGIDKPDVRIVVHVDAPSSVEAYFQEAGRAGRDGKKAYAVLLYNDADPGKLAKRIGDTFPPLEYVRRVYDSLAYFYEIAVGDGYNVSHEFPVERFCRIYGFFPIQVISALEILDRAGYIEYMGGEENQSRIHFILERDDLYRLRGNSPLEDRLIETLLRQYSGLFSDFVYIDEALIGYLTDLTPQQVYMVLKELSKRRILEFIPRKSIPKIRYRQRREDSEDLRFPRPVYQNLKEKMEERIGHMINYLTTHNQCRSSMLLRYFGEESKDDCGQCDVCLSRRNDPEEQQAFEDAKKYILDLLNSSDRVNIRDLNNAPFAYRHIEAAMQFLIDERIATHHDFYLYLNR